MRNWLAICTLLVLSSCAATTKNVGGAYVDHFSITSASAVPQVVKAGDEVTVTLDFTFGSPPYSFAVIFSNGVEPARQTIEVDHFATSASITVRTEPGSSGECKAVIAAWDAAGTWGAGWGGQPTAYFTIVP